MNENKKIRLRTNINSDSIINVKLEQDIDFLEVLSIKIKQEDVYKIQTPNYGVIIGRVQANDGFGIPNAKISVFIELSDTDKSNSNITSIYPYAKVSSVNKDGVRYNLLSSQSNKPSHTIIGTFPSKEDVLENDIQIEVYEKYWKYTTTTNHAGDYMLFGVPTGNHILHVDIDLSDIGVLSQKPIDFYYKGYNEKLFESSNKFKYSTNLDSLAQVITQNKSVQVYPFWGDKNTDNISISRCDININYKFEPTCVFMGSIVTDNSSNIISHKCVNHSGECGVNKSLISKSGSIEMIRKTIDGKVEEFTIQGNELIDGDGVWCYQIPMNLDYVITDEFGNIIPTDNPNKGIPTRTNVRFRISIDNMDTLHESNYTAKYLVPNLMTDNDVSCYNFGTNTPNDLFRDLFWNDVYTVKNYIPRLQKGTNNCNKKSTGIKFINYHEDKNPFPYNKINICKKWWVGILCAIFMLIIEIIRLFNNLSFGESSEIRVSITDDDGNETIYWPDSNVNNHAECLKLRVQKYIIDAYKIVDLGFYNDWVNGTLYAPLLNFRKHENGVLKWCQCDYTNRKNNGIHLFDNCYDGENKDVEKNYKLITSDGIVYQTTNMDGLSIFYYAAKYNNANMFSTDIVLLGNLNNETKLLDFLPQTTAKIPRLFGDYLFCSNEKNYNIQGGSSSMNKEKKPFKTIDETMDIDDYITPMDWGDTFDIDELEQETINSNNKKNTFSIEKFKIDTINQRYISNGDDKNRGLFFNFNCLKVSSLPKTCYNAKRICELGVGFDTDRFVYSNGQYKSLPSDGVILRNDIINADARSLFATYNSNNLLSKYINRDTLYKKNRFTFLYPNNFDGGISGDKGDKLISIVGLDNVRVGVKDTDNADYINFRGGYDNSSTAIKMHNNSFYFYFGINPGRTAIDKFNQLFNQKNYIKNTKYFDIITKVTPSTPDKFLCSGKIAYELVNIVTPYTIVLKSASTNEILYSYDNLNNINGEFTDLCSDNYELIITDSLGNRLNTIVRVDDVKLFFDVSHTNFALSYADKTNVNNYDSDIVELTLYNFASNLFEENEFLNNSDFNKIIDLTNLPTIRVQNGGFGYDEYKIIIDFKDNVDGDKSWFDTYYGYNDKNIDNKTITLLFKIPGLYTLNIFGVINGVDHQLNTVSVLIDDVQYSKILINGVESDVLCNKGIDLRYKISYDDRIDSTVIIDSKDSNLSIKNIKKYSYNEFSSSNNKYWYDRVELIKIQDRYDIKQIMELDKAIKKNAISIIQHKVLNTYELCDSVYCINKNPYVYINTDYAIPNTLVSVSHPSYTDSRFLANSYETYIEGDINKPILIGKNFGVWEYKDSQWTFKNAIDEYNIPYDYYGYNTIFNEYEKNTDGDNDTPSNIISNYIATFVSNKPYQPSSGTVSIKNDKVFENVSDYYNWYLGENKEYPLQNYIGVSFIDGMFDYDIRIISPYYGQNCEGRVHKSIIEGVYINPMDMIINGNTITQYSNISDPDYTNGFIVSDYAIINGENSYYANDNICSINNTNDIDNLFKLLTELIRVIELNNVEDFNFGSYNQKVINIRDIIYNDKVSINDKSVNIIKYCINNKHDVNIFKFVNEYAINGISEQFILNCKFNKINAIDSVDINFKSFSDFINLCSEVFGVFFINNCENSYSFNIDYNLDDDIVSFNNLIDEFHIPSLLKQLELKLESKLSSYDDRLLVDDNEYSSNEFIDRYKKVLTINSPLNININNSTNEVKSNGITDKTGNLLPIRIIEKELMSNWSILKLSHQGYSYNVSVSESSDKYTYLKTVPSLSENISMEYKCNKVHSIYHKTTDKIDDVIDVLFTKGENGEFIFNKININIRYRGDYTDNIQDNSIDKPIFILDLDDTNDRTILDCLEEYTTNAPSTFKVMINKSYDPLIDDYLIFINVNNNTNENNYSTAYIINRTHYFGDQESNRIMHTEIYNVLEMIDLQSMTIDTSKKIVIGDETYNYIEISKNDNKTIDKILSKGNEINVSGIGTCYIVSNVTICKASKNSDIESYSIAKGLDGKKLYVVESKFIDMQLSYILKNINIDDDTYLIFRNQSSEFFNSEYINYCVKLGITVDKIPDDDLGEDDSIKPLE